MIKTLKNKGHFLGVHSDKHLLYCDWQQRDSLLVTKQQFTTDLQNAYQALGKTGISSQQAHYFLPPYEWYNDSIAAWTKALGLQLINFTPGTRSNADYTYPEMGARYVDSKTILQSVLQYEAQSANGLNGFILLVHIGTDPRRKDKFYRYLPQMIAALKKQGYHFSRIDELLRPVGTEGKTGL